MAQNTSIINLVGNVANPASTNQPDASTPLFSSGRQGEMLVSEIHGLYYTAAYRRNLFKANVTAKTIPVVASGVVSVFTLYNPAASGVVAEIVSVTIPTVAATTVVDTVGWYYSNAQLSLAGTFTTLGVAGTNLFSARIGETPANQVAFYSAYTHSGTPVRTDIIGGWGATTNANSSPVQKIYNGSLILPPGIAMSICASTAAAGTSGSDPECVWAEWLA